MTKILSGLGPNDSAPFKLEDYTTPAIAGPYSDQLFDVACRTGKANTSYPTLTRAYMTVAQGSYSLKNMRIMFMNTVKSDDWIRLGLYNSSKNLMGKTDRFHPAPSQVMTEPLLAPQDINGGDIYYVAWSIVSSAPGNTYFPVYGLGDTLTEEPLVQLSDTANEMPNSLGAGGLVSVNRVWLAWTA